MALAQTREDTFFQMIQTYKDRFGEPTEKVKKEWLLLALQYGFDIDYIPGQDDGAEPEQ